MPSDGAISRQVPVRRTGASRRRRGCCASPSCRLAGDREHAEDVDAGLLHAVLGILGGALVEGAAGVDVDEDLVAGLAEG